MPVPMHPRVLHVADILLGAEKTGHDLAHWLDSAAGGASAWTEHLAQSVLERIREQIRIGAPVGGAMADALARAATAAAEFSREHPEFLTILALGALMVLAPWVLETLGFWVLRAAGFAAKGPVAGSFMVMVGTQALYELWRSLSLSIASTSSNEERLQL